VQSAESHDARHVTRRSAHRETSSRANANERVLVSYSSSIFSTLESAFSIDSDTIALIATGEPLSAS